MKSDNFLVIMAGGIGARFWPLSRKEKPKQFIDILGTGSTLIQQTYNRFLKVIPESNIYIVTSAEYYGIVKEQLPNLTDDQILLEPARRNTAPCIAYANAKIQAKNPNANIVVAPSDHLILNEEEFVKKINEALEFTKTNDALLTIGIKPTRPETGYGYIQVKKSSKGCSGIDKVKTFTEKPNLEMAKIFMESGEFFWNSGIFIWKLSSIMSGFSNYLPDIFNLFEESKGAIGTSDEKSIMDTTYESCRSISIDYGVMEKADNVYVMCGDFGWSDLGTWGSLYEHSSYDESSNARIGGTIIPIDTEGSIIRADENKLIVVKGLKDYLVIQSDNSILIMPKAEEQMIRDIVDKVDKL